MDYFIKVSIVLFIFYAAYKLFLQRETFFHSNRWFLLIGTLVSFSLPLVIIPIYIIKESYTTSSLAVSDNVIISESVAESAISISEVIFYIYMIGLLLFTTKFIIQLSSLFLLIFRSEKNKVGSFIHVKVNEKVSPFSFFMYIVYNPSQYSDEDLSQIIAHEKVHARQWHSVDILISQVAAIINWFNPIFWLYKKELQQNLEFIADERAQQQSECHRTYQHLLLKTTMPSYKMALANNFYNSLIKKRIVMLHKNRSKKTKQWKTAIVLPCLALFLMSFNTKEIVTYETPDFTTEMGTTVVPEKEVEIIVITKDMTDKELKALSEKMEKKGITLKFKGVKRNKNNEIIAIEISAKTKNATSTFGESDEGPIQPITIKITDNKSISIGNGKDSGHRDYMYETKDGKHKVHKSKGSDNVFVYSSDEHSDHDEDVHEIIKDGEKIIIKSDGKEKIIRKGDGASVFTFESDGDGEHEDHEIIKVKEGDNDEKIIIKKIKGDKTKKVKEGSNIWISNDDDEDNIFTIKGKNKLFFSSDSDENPLFILDGKEVAKEKIDNLDSENIETMDVLKGDSATKKYGDKGKDGVVIIKTKDN